MKSHLYMAAAMIALVPVQSHAAVTVYTATLTGAAEAPPQWLTWKRHGNCDD